MRKTTRRHFTQDAEMLYPSNDSPLLVWPLPPLTLTPRYFVVLPFL
jgi:hypothetical protein